MSPQQQEVFSLAMQLEPNVRLELAHQLLASVVDDQIDHGPTDPPEEVEAAWGSVIKRRLEEIDSGKVKMIPAEEVWKMIREGKRPGS